MKKISICIVTLLLSLVLFACTAEPIPPDDDSEAPTIYTVTFNSAGGSSVADQLVEENGLATEPSDPTRDDYIFIYWYVTDENIAFQFNTPITLNLTLTAKWEEIPDPEVGKTNIEKIDEDIAAIEANFLVNRYYVNTPSSGPVNGSTIRWTSTNKYISSNGVILPVLSDESEQTGILDARFTLNGTIVNHQFDIELTHVDPVVIAEERIIPFENITTEYNVENSEVTLLFEENGSVPYIRVEDFFNLLTGFIDPEYDITFTTEDNILTISYQYIDEEEHQEYLDGLSEFDGIYDLILEIDADNNTLTTPDPGFYWAYVYSTATNYGRHIKYDRNHDGAYSESGDDLIYDLDLYGLDVVVYGDEIVVPYYIANQLFAGSSYYNVYYNYDALYGIYALPSADTEEYDAIRTSSKNNQALPADLMAHTFNYLAFSFDYFYGLQEIQEIETYYDLLFTYKDSLLNDSASGFETGLFEFINKVLDEPHSSYGYPGYYNRKTNNGPSLSLLSQLGPRVRAFYNNGLYAVDDAIEAKWEIVKTNPNAWAYTDPARPQFWFLDDDKKSVVLSLDEFVTSDIQENAVWYEENVSNVLKHDASVVPALNGGTKYFYYNSSPREYQVLEVLVKGLGIEDLNAYKTSLVSSGFVLDETTSKYQKNIDDHSFYVSVSFDATYGLFYLGIVKLDIEADVTDQLTVLDNTAETLVYADSAVFMEVMLEAIVNTAPNVENIVLDITFNTGGNVGALYRVLGFITSSSFIVSSIDGDTGGRSSSYVYIDGVPNYDYLNWALLTSPATFSAANSLATIFQDNNLGPIIGAKSGGGASSITPILLPNGTAFTMSSNNISAYRTGDGTDENPYVYHSNEFGIEPDYAVPIYTGTGNQIFANIYDNETLLDILAEAFN